MYSVIICYTKHIALDYLVEGVSVSLCVSQVILSCRRIFFFFSFVLGVFKKKKSLVIQSQWVFRERKSSTHPIHPPTSRFIIIYYFFFFLVM
ncbi:hypothetical protein CAAN1_12S01244 [[Candida] anglica]|uniref:Uncharacterized protein n=1 Tax=[Candida] anglica TaxID=148631 RepID=A0ABP0E778_9ASCO